MIQRTLLLCIVSLIPSFVIAQFLPGIDHAGNRSLSDYIKYTKTHSALKPIYIDSLHYKEQSADSGHSLLRRKLYEEHLVDLGDREYRLMIDFLPDMYIGKQSNPSKFIWNNTRGISISGSYRSVLSFRTEIYENQSVFPDYYDSLIFKMNAIPGQGWSKTSKRKIFSELDYAYTTGHISYKSGPVNLHLANDYLFIGNGYRSLLLSDVAVPYPYFKTSFEYKRIQYAAIYAHHIDRHAKPLSNVIGAQRKWAVFHYLDIRIGKRWNLGLFDAVVWQDADSTGKRGFEFSYANPILFARTVEYSLESKDNALVGLNLNYHLGENNDVYGQFALDEFKLDEIISGKGWWANKFAAQLGIKTRSLFGIPALYAFSEFNLARPYTYSHQNSLKSYSHYNDALAHPMGANFMESVSKISYLYKRYGLSLQINYAQSGIDSNAHTSVGQDILKSYNLRNQEYGNKILQGVPVKFIFADFRIYYLLNPKYNLRLEVGYLYRSLQTGTHTNATGIILVGLRSSFRNLYIDR